MAYLLDTDVFIRAKNLHYGFDFCPAFWEWLIVNNASGLVFSIEKIGDEIEAGNDELAAWAKQRGPSFFLKPDTEILRAFEKVSAFVSSQGYEQSAVSTFLQIADYYLVTHALAHDYIVVTHEIVSPSIRKIKIPNVCIGLKIKFMTPYQMLRRERARFVLGSSGRNI